jgi:hypothetical protein
MDSLFSIIIVIAITLIGYMFAKVISRFIYKFGRRKRKLSDQGTFATLIEKLIMIFTIFVAIIYLGINTTERIIMMIKNMIPSIAIVILMFILGSVVINLIMWFIKKFVSYIRAEDYFSPESRNIIGPALHIFVQIIMYLILGHIIFSIVEIPVLQTTLSFILYPVIISFFILMLIGMINPARDFFSRFYLLGLDQYRKGAEITIDKKNYSILHIKSLHTELVDDKKGLLVVPHRIMANKTIHFKKPMKELETLKQIKDAFVEQMKSHCGPATAQMVLSIFHYSISQKELGRIMGTVVRKDEKGVAGTHPKAIIDAVEKVSDRNVKGAWISFDKISDLRQEILIWLNQGALIIIDYKKKYLFPDAKNAHYSLVVGVKEDELIIIDPSSKSGGVYFADYRDLLIGMDTYSELIKGKRGYIVVAPKGTEAFYRITKKLIYLHPSMYDKLTKRLTLYLGKMSNLSSFSETLPPFLQKYVDKFNREQISRVWQPKKK